MKSNYKINEEQLLKYLNGSLNNDELHEFEKKMADSTLLNDAVEGLQTIKNKTSIDHYVSDLNKQLHEFTTSKKRRRLKNKSSINFWIIASIVLIIIICIIGYFTLDLTFKTN